MNIFYKPNIGIEFSKKIISWNTNREMVRKILNSEYECGDYELDNSEFFNGNKSYNIISKRDIYKNISNEICLIFFNYDENEKLDAIEIHNGVKLQIGENQIDFSQNIDEISRIIGNESDEITKGNIIFKKFKMNISSTKYMGGDSEKLGYIFLSRDEIINE